MALTKTGLTFVNGTTPAINDTNLNKINDLTDDLVDYVETRTDLGETTVTQAITSIGTDSLGGKLTADLTGVTTVNLLDDDVAGCESTTGWTTGSSSVAIDSSNKFEGTNCLKITISASGGGIYRDVFSLVDISKNYLVSAYVKNGDLSGDGMKLYISLTGGAGDLYSSSVSSTTYTRVGYVLQASDFTSVTNFYIGAAGFGSNTEYGFVDAIQLQEITSAEYALGASALLDKYPYHRGLADSQPQEVKVTGKNLFDKTDITRGYQVDNTDGTLSASTGEDASNFIVVEADTNHFISGCSNTTNTDGAYYDINQNYISGFTSYGAITTPTNAKYIRFTVDEDDLDTAMLEVSSSATTYEAYKDTIAYTPVLRSVPEIADTLGVNEGKGVRNVKQHTLLSGDIDSVANGSNLQRAVIGLDAFSGIKTQTASTIDLETLVSGLSAETDGYDTSGDAGKWYTDASNLYILAALGTWADVAAARTALTSTVTTLINYQLATPETITLDPEVLTAFEDGTIFIDSKVKEQNVYSSGLTIDDSTKPISSLDYVAKFDLTTEEQTQIDISDCTVAGDGLSFTISGASDDEVYVYVYNYVNLSTIPTLAYNYPTNIAGQTKDNSRDLGLLDLKLQNAKDRTLANRNEIDLMNVLTTQGDILYHDANGYQRLAKGTAYQHLGINSGATAPEWQESANSVLTAQGDILYADGANSLARLAKGTAGQILKMNSGATAPEWGSQGWVTISNTVLSTTASQIDVTIPTTYQFVKVFIHSRSSNSNQDLNLRFNDVSTSSYLWRDVVNGITNVDGSDTEIKVENGGSDDATTEITVNRSGAVNSCIFAVADYNNTTITNGIGGFSGGSITEINLIPVTNDFASGTEVLVMGVVEA